MSGLPATRLDSSIERGLSHRGDVVSGDPAASVPRWLNHPATISLSIFAVVLATCLPAGLMANTLETLIYARHWIDPTFISDDWRMGHPLGPRLPFTLIVAPFLKVFSIEQVNTAGAVAGYLILAGGLGLLFSRLGLSAIEAVIVIAAFLFARQSIAAGEGIFSILESKTFGYSLVFAAIALASRNRIVLAAVALGLSTTMHVLVGGWAALCLAFAVLATGRGSRRAHGLAVLAFLAGALPGIAAMVPATSADLSPLPDGVTAEYIYVYLRAPHHLDPWALVHYVHRTPLKQLVLGLAVCAAVAFFFVPRVIDRSDPRLLVVRFLQASLIPVLAGGIAGFVPGGERFLRFYPFRIADTLFPLLGTAVILSLLLPLVWPGKRGLAIRVATGLTAIAALAIADPSWYVRSHFERPPAGFERAANFVRENMPVGQPILVSPHNAFAGYWMERPVVASWKFVPHDQSGLAEWYRRMVDLRAIIPADSATQGPRRHAVGAFEQMATEEYVEIARKYGSSYLIARRREEIALPIVFDSDPFAVYATTR